MIGHVRGRVGGFGIDTDMMFLKRPKGPVVHPARALWPWN